LAESEPRRIQIVNEDIVKLVTELRTLIAFLNRFFSESFTEKGRLKVASIPITIGDSKEAEQNMVVAISRIPTLLEELTKEIKQTREALEKVLTPST